MATVDKNFRVKNGLIVEGNTAKVDDKDILLDGDSIDLLTEGENNLFYTDTKVFDKIKTAIVQGTGITVGSDAEEETLTIEVDTSEIATREYVDAVSEGLHIHASVATATTQNIENLGSPPATIDGVTLVEGMRVLVKDQENSTFNGIYVFEDGVLLRADDHNTANEIQAGDFVFVEGGETYASTGWVQLNSVTTLGTDLIEWTQFLGAGTFVGGNGIDVEGQLISIDFADFDTDDISEGDANLYYTDQRVIDVLTGSSQTNISITEYDGQLIIEAENGVDDSTTDDLVEGTTNFYFTDQRAVDALEAVTPNFTEVEINSVSKQVAASIVATDNVGGFTAYSFDPTEYRAAKFLVKAAQGSHTQISEILLTLDTSDNVSMTEYAIITTNGILIETFAEKSGGQIILVVNAENANTTVNVFGTLIA